MPDQNDHLAILNLYARINRAWDDGDVQAFIDCFCEDASYERPFVGNGLVTRGHFELLELANDHARKLPTSEPKRHLSSNVIVVVDDDSAAGACDHMVITVGQNGSPPRFHSTGRCEDSFARTASGWKLARRIKKHDFIE